MMIHECDFLKNSESHLVCMSSSVGMNVWVYSASHVVCVDAWSGSEALGQQEAELFPQLGVTRHLQRVSTASVCNLCPP